MAGPVDPSIHDRPVPESAGRPVVTPCDSDTAPLEESPVPAVEPDQEEQSTSDNDNHDLPEIFGAAPATPGGTRVPRIGERIESTTLLAHSPNDLFIDREGHVLLRNESIDDMLSRLDDEVDLHRRISDDSAKLGTAPVWGETQLPEGLRLLPPGVQLEYDWIDAVGRDGEDSSPGPPMIQLGLRVAGNSRRGTPSRDVRSRPGPSVSSDRPSGAVRGELRVVNPDSPDPSGNLF